MKNNQRKIPNFSEFLNEKQNNNFERLYEFLNTEMLALKNYLTLDKEKQKDDLANTFPFLWEYFAKEHNYDPNKVQDFDDIDELTSEEKKKFKDWLYKQIVKLGGGHLPIMDADIPSWFYFDYIKIVKNQWLVHLTDYPFEIVKDGFTKGVMAVDKLGLTTAFGGSIKEFGGYNFAYDIDDVERYGRASRNSMRDEYNYGDEAVFFRGSGVKVYHYGDEEDQVIFFGKSVTNRIAAVKDDEVPVWEDSKWALISNKTDRPIVKKDTLGELGYWLQQNEQQYKSHISNK